MPSSRAGKPNDSGTYHLRRGIIRQSALWALCRYRHNGHWSGHASRLNRDMKGRYGSAAYAMEELRAELASAFLASELGIPTDVPQHASYIDNWIKPLKDDKREIFRAAADAQKIADMLLGFHPDYAAQLDLPPPAPRTADQRLTLG
jgi:antirestriction protein ArdC